MNPYLGSPSRYSSQIALSIAKLQARAVPKIQEKYHMLSSPNKLNLDCRGWFARLFFRARRDRPMRCRQVLSVKR